MTKQKSGSSKKAERKESLPHYPDRGPEVFGQLPNAFELFQPSVRMVMDNLAAFLLLSGIPLVIFLLSTIASNGKNTFSIHPWLVLNVVGMLIYLVVAPGVLLLQLKSVRRQSATAGEAFQQGIPYIARLLGLSIVLVIGLTVAFLLLIVPFFIVLPRVVLAPYFLVDRDLGVFEALRQSNEMYKRHHGIWGIIGVSVLMDVTSVIPVLGPIIRSCLGFLYQPALALRYEQVKLLDEGKLPQTPAEAEYAGE